MIERHPWYHHEDEFPMVTTKRVEEGLQVLITPSADNLYYYIALENWADVKEVIQMLRNAATEAFGNEPK